MFLRPRCSPALPAPGRRARGFTVLELLLVIAIITLFSSIAIGWFGGSGKEAIERVTNQRNAQEIVSLGVCAIMGDAEFVVKGDKQATAVNLSVGVVGRQGQLKGKTFRLTNLKPTDLPGALEFVKFNDGLLLYDPAGGQL